jgi:hypothetical protein
LLQQQKMPDVFILLLLFFFFFCNQADFLYKENDILFCMNPESFEQYEIDANVFGTAADYLTGTER